MSVQPDGEYANRQFNLMDLRELKSLRAQFDHPIFQRMYFSLQDTWMRAYPTGSMPRGELLRIVHESDRAIASEKAKLAKREKATA